MKRPTTPDRQRVRAYTGRVLSTVRRPDSRDGVRTQARQGWCFRLRLRGPRPVRTPRLGGWLAKRRRLGPAVSKRLAIGRLHAEAARASRLGVPGTLMCELVQYLGKLLTRHDLVGAVLRQLLKRGADLLTDGGMRRHVVGKLVQGRRDLLLLLGGDLLGLAELLAETLLAETVLAEARLAAEAACRIEAGAVALAQRTLSGLTEGRIAEDGVADLGSNSLQASIAAHRAGWPEDGGCQRLSEIRSVVSVRHEILHWLSSE
jgi:hypothetical protein